jgi:prohibitin 2
MAQSAWANKMPKGGGPLVSLVNAAVVVGGVGYGLYHSVFTVEGGHRAIVFNRLTGIKEQTYSEGMHFVIPWVEWPYIYDVRTRPRNVQSLTGSKDLQMVNITLRVLSKPNPTALPFIYRRLGRDYDERVLPSVVNEVTKAVVAKFNAAELLTKREEVSKMVSAIYPGDEEGVLNQASAYFEPYFLSRSKMLWWPGRRTFRLNWTM